jgi:hypothetical protein
MSALLASTPEYRALELMSVLPAGCIAFPVVDGWSAPHLKPGEFAVVDTNDREPANGELYVITWSPGTDHEKREITQITGRMMVVCDPQTHEPLPPAIRWFAGDYVRPRGRDELQDWIAKGRVLRLSEGPFRTEHLREKLVGRIIGIYAPDFEEGSLKAVTHG